MLARCKQDLRDQTRRARLRRYVIGQAGGPTIRTRMRKHPRYKKTQVLQAIKGSYGVKKTVCERLKCCRLTFDKLLSRVGWEPVAMAWAEEREKLADIAQKGVVEAIKQSLDMGTKARTALKVLEHMDPRFAPPAQKVEIQGGEVPIKHAHVHVQIPIEALESAPEVKRAILEQTEPKEEE